MVFHLPVFSISGTGIHLHLFSYKRHKHIHGTSLVVQWLGLGACTAKHRLHFIWQPAFRGHDALHGTTPEKPPMFSQPCLDIAFLASIMPGVSQELGWPKKFQMVTSASSYSLLYPQHPAQSLAWPQYALDE